ncbi:4373_t:CDS:2, partial [Cetraspora pellucida]
IATYQWSIGKISIPIVDLVIYAHTAAGLMNNYMLITFDTEFTSSNQVSIDTKSSDSKSIGLIIGATIDTINIR